MGGNEGIRTDFNSQTTLHPREAGSDILSDHRYTSTPSGTDFTSMETIRPRSRVTSESLNEGIPNSEEAKERDCQRDFP